MFRRKTYIMDRLASLQFFQSKFNELPSAGIEDFVHDMGVIIEREISREIHRKKLRNIKNSYKRHGRK